MLANRLLLGLDMLLDPSLVSAYLAVATVLALSPGPDTMFVLAAGTSGGARLGISATLGIATGSLAHATMAALGISALIAASPIAFDVVRNTGALYLLWIGAIALCDVMRRKQSNSVATAAGNSSALDAYRSGLLTNVLNPKVGVFYIAFLPQFANSDFGPIPLQIILLGLVHNAIGTMWLIFLSLASGRVSQVVSQNRRIRAWLNGIAGLVYVALAVRMVFLERRPA